jgi:hypothetical protein
MQTHKKGRAATKPVATNHNAERELCGGRESAFESTWLLIGALPVLEVPPRVKERFLAAAGLLVPPRIDRFNR